jgi:hypothetical protein
MTPATDNITIYKYNDFARLYEFVDDTTDWSGVSFKAEMRNVDNELIATFETEKDDVNHRLTIILRKEIIADIPLGVYLFDLVRQSDLRFIIIQGNVLIKEGVTH